MKRAILLAYGERALMDSGSPKRLSIARIFAAAGSIDDTIASCTDARRSSLEAFRTLEVLERLLHAEGSGEIAAAIAHAKTHLERSAAAIMYASASAEAVAKTIRFDAA